MSESTITEVRQFRKIIYAPDSDLMLIILTRFVLLIDTKMEKIIMKILKFLTVLMGMVGVIVVGNATQYIQRYYAEKG